MVPGVFLLTSKFYRPGTAAACNMEAPDAAHTPFWTSLTSQAITPIAEKESIYYFSSCLERARANDQQADAQIDLFRRAFDEDNAMIEAQQRVIDLTSEPRMLATSADGPLNQFRQLMADLIEQERSPQAEATRVSA
jgi:vanillate O-demethylase monooxygenase subunit